MSLAHNGIIPYTSWSHNRYLTNDRGETVQDILIRKDMYIPDEWIYGID